MPSIPFSVKRYFKGLKRPQVFTVATRNFEDQDGLPYIGTMFCMTIKGLAPIRWAISMAIMQFAIAFSIGFLSVTLYISGTSSELANILHTRCIVSNCTGSKKLNPTCTGAATVNACPCFSVFWISFISVQFTCWWIVLDTPPEFFNKFFQGGFFYSCRNKFLAFFLQR